MSTRRCTSSFSLGPIVGSGFVLVMALSVLLHGMVRTKVSPRSAGEPKSCVTQIGDPRKDSNRVSIVLEMDSASASNFKVIGIENVVGETLQHTWVWQQAARAVIKGDRKWIPVLGSKIGVRNIVTDTVYLHLVLAFSGTESRSVERQKLIRQLSEKIDSLGHITTLVVWFNDRSFQVSRSEGLESLKYAMEQSMSNPRLDSKQGALDIINRSVKKRNKGFRNDQNLSLLLIVTDVQQEKVDEILPSEIETRAKGYSVVLCRLSDESAVSVNSAISRRAQLAALAARLRDRDSVAVDSVFGDLFYSVRPRRLGPRGSVKDTLRLHLIIALSESEISALRFEQLLDQFREPLDSLEQITTPMYSLNDMGGAVPDKNTLERSLRSLYGAYVRRASKNDAMSVIERSVNIRRLSPRRPGGKDIVFLVTDLSREEMSRISDFKQLSIDCQLLACFLSGDGFGTSNSNDDEQDILDQYANDRAVEDSAWMNNAFGVLGLRVRQQRPNRIEISWTNDWIVQSTRRSEFELTLQCNQRDTLISVPIEYDSLYCRRSQGRILGEAAINTGKMTIDSINQVVQRISELVPLDQCEHLMDAIYQRAVALLEDGDESDGLQLVERLEGLFQADLGWRQNFATAYLKAARIVAKRNNHSQAVDLADRSFRYEATKESQELIQEQARYNNDYERALNAAEWKYNNVDLTSTETKRLMNDMADLYANSGDFERAFQSALKGREKSDGDSSGISKAILILKSEWAVIIGWFAAQSLGAQSQEANLKDANQLLLNLPEILTVSLCGANLTPIFRISRSKSGEAVSSKFEGSMNSGLATAFAKKKEFALEFDTSGHFGRAIIPTGGGRYLVTTFSAEGGRDEEILASQLQTNPNDSKTWSQYRRVLDSRRIEAAVKTLGFAFEHVANGDGGLLKLIRLWGSKFPKSASAYEIVSLRSGDSCIVTKLSGLVTLDDATLNDSEANRHPIYLKKTREAGNQTVEEYTIALYRNGLWAGTFRIGLRDRM